MPTPDLDVATRLAAASPAPDLGALGTNIFQGPVRPPVAGLIPHAAIFVLATGGPSPDPYFSVGGASASFFRVGVQVRIRSAVDAFATGQTTALNVRAKLHLANLTGYVACRVRESHPLYLGTDDTEHHEFSVNVELWFKE